MGATSPSTPSGDETRSALGMVVDIQGRAVPGVAVVLRGEHDTRGAWYWIRMAPLFRGAGFRRRRSWTRVW